MTHQSTDRETNLLEALRRLPYDRWNEVRDFVDFIAARERQQAERESREISLDSSLLRDIEQGRAELKAGEEVPWEEVREDV